MGIQTRIWIGQEVKARSIGYQLSFKRPAKTSRDVMVHHHVMYLILEGPNGTGIGEYAPIPGLSLESATTFDVLFEEWKNSDKKGDLAYWRLKSSAFCFAVESAILSYHNGLNPSFAPIPINGLVWMNDCATMLNEAKLLVDQNFDCIKLKVGALNWIDEMHTIDQLRGHAIHKNVTIRLDANGAFEEDQALSRISELLQRGIHSLEQPIRAGNWSAMAKICAESPIPIALDEELIGIHQRDVKMELLETIKPAYIVLKPSLHGGLSGCDEWIALAENRGIKWWVTSALESNIGLYAIASWVAKKKYLGHQGLGTGSLYLNNISSPLQVMESQLCFEPSKTWDLSIFKLVEL